MKKKNQLHKAEKDKTKAQTHSAYDSHSEEKPQQKEIIDASSNPDRVSYDNTEDYLDKIPLQIEKAQELNDEESAEKKGEKKLEKE
jgi:hypothetical protein